MDKQAMNAAKGRIETNNGTYQDLAVLGEYYFARLAELGIAIEEASKNGDPRELTEGLGMNVANTACEMASYFDYEAGKKQDGQQSDAKSQSIDEKQLKAVLFELSSCTSFLSDTSRLLQEFHLFDEDNQGAILSSVYIEQLAEAMHVMTGKQFELLSILEAQLGIHGTAFDKADIGLFETPKALSMFKS